MMLTTTTKKNRTAKLRYRRIFRLPWLSIVVATGALGACAYEPPRQVVRTTHAPAPPPPSTEVYFYPTKGQSAEQQDRDRYECYLWAVKQTGFDPSGPQLAPHMRIEVVPVPPPGHDTATGAAAGAVLGAVVSPPRRAPEGAIMGAIAGAAVGAASDAARQERAEREQARLDERQTARLEQQASSYRRAMGACLEGRGYTVK